MAAASYDLTIEQGAYWSQRILWKDEAGVPVPLTGYSARMQVRRSVQDSTVLLSLAVGSGITLEPAAAAGVILLEQTATQTAAIPASIGDFRWVYDLEMVPGDSHVVRLMQGRITISLEVTR